MQVKQATTPVLCGVCQDTMTTQTVEITNVRKSGKEETLTIPCCLSGDCRSRVYNLQQERANMDEENAALMRVLKKDTLHPVQTYEYIPSALAKEKARTLAKKVAGAKNKAQLLAILEKARGK